MMGLHSMNQLITYVDRKGNLFDTIGRGGLQTPRQDEERMFRRARMPEFRKDALNQSISTVWDHRRLK